MGGKRQGGDGGGHRGGGRHGGGGGGGSNKKHKYMPSPKTSRALPEKARGLIITCDNGREERTLQELTPVVEEHYDKLLASKGGSAPAPAKEEDKPAGDIAAALAAEVAQLKDRSQKRFKSYNTGVKGCTFLEFPSEPAFPAPADVVASICEEALATKVLRSRFVHRLLPVTHSCFAGLDEMKALAPAVLAPEFPKELPEGEEGTAFAVEYEHRSAEKLDRLAIINAFVDNIPTPPHKVNLKGATKTIIVQMVRNACGVSVVTRYRELNKFNLRKCAEVPEEEGEEKAEKDGKGKAAASKAEEEEEDGDGEAAAEEGDKEDGEQGQQGAAAEEGGGE